MTKKIIPFGKYKGQPVEILQADPKYSEWLQAQQWFREKFMDLFSMVSAVQAPTESPAHNIMQARFLDKEYRDRFILSQHAKAIIKKQNQLRVVGQFEKLEGFAYESRG